MGFQSKTYSLSDEVVGVIEMARANGETPNKFLRRVLGIDKNYRSPAEMRRAQRGESTRLDVIGPELSSGRGKATTETRVPRQKGDKTR